MQVLVTFVILFGLPFIIYFLIIGIQWLIKNANLKSEKGLIVTAIIGAACLCLSYYTKGVFIALIVFLFLPIIFIIGLDAQQRILSNNQSNIIENLNIKNNIPFSLLFIGYILFFATAAWLIKYASNKRLVIYFIFFGVVGFIYLIKKKTKDS